MNQRQGGLFVLNIVDYFGAGFIVFVMVINLTDASPGFFEILWDDSLRWCFVILWQRFFEILWDPLRSFVMILWDSLRRFSTFLGVSFESWRIEKSGEESLMQLWWRHTGHDRDGGSVLDVRPEPVHRRHRVHAGHSVECLLEDQLGLPHTRHAHLHLLLLRFVLPTAHRWQLRLPSTSHQWVFISPTKPRLFFFFLLETWLYFIFLGFWLLFFPFPTCRGSLWFRWIVPISSIHLGWNVAAAHLIVMMFVESPVDPSQSALIGHFL